MIIIVAQLSLYQELFQLRPQMASAAQTIYDSWTQDENGFDEEVGAGGICDQISEEIGGVIGLAGIDCEFEEAGQDGDDHSALIVSRGAERYIVDIPYHLYETGGGYSWKKIPGVQFSPDSVEIFKV